METVSRQLIFGINFTNDSLDVLDIYTDGNLRVIFSLPSLFLTLSPCDSSFISTSRVWPDTIHNIQSQLEGSLTAWHTYLWQPGCRLTDPHGNPGSEETSSQPARSGNGGDWTFRRWSSVHAAGTGTRYRTPGPPRSSRYPCSCGSLWPAPAVVGRGLTMMSRDHHMIVT